MGGVEKSVLQGFLCYIRVFFAQFATMYSRPDGNKKDNDEDNIDEDDIDFWFGFEQEYFLIDPETNLPLGFPAGGYPAPQGPYYCGVGAKSAYGREIIEEHLDLCLKAGLNIEGINAEVAAGQWEFQIFAKGAAQAGDEIWVGRYLIERTAEKYGVAVLQKGWNSHGDYLQALAIFFYETSLHIMLPQKILSETGDTL